MQFLNTRVPSGRVLGVIIANPQHDAVYTLSWTLDSSFFVHFCNSNLYKEAPRYPLGVSPPSLTAKSIFWWSLMRFVRGSFYSQMKKKRILKCIRPSMSLLANRIASIRIRLASLALLK